MSNGNGNPRGRGRPRHEPVGGELPPNKEAAASAQVGRKHDSLADAALVATLRKELRLSDGCPIGDVLWHAVMEIRNLRRG